MYDSAYTGIISLMYKGAGDRSLRENWRPLTLLNVDYKIYAKVLARSDQHGCLSRIDRIYISVNLCDGVLSTTRSVNRTDHKLYRIKLNLKFAASLRGRGFYKINTLLLAEIGFENYVIPRLQNILNNQENSCDLWEIFKYEVKDYFQRLGKLRAKERNMQPGLAVSVSVKPRD